MHWGVHHQSRGTGCSLSSGRVIYFQGPPLTPALCEFWAEKGGILKSCPRVPKLKIWLRRGWGRCLNVTLQTRAPEICSNLLFYTYWKYWSCKSGTHFNIQLPNELIHCTINMVNIVRQSSFVTDYESYAIIIICRIVESRFVYFSCVFSF